MSCRSLKMPPYQRAGSPSKSLVVFNEELVKLADNSLHDYKQRLEWHTAFPNIKKYLNHVRPFLVEGVVKDVQYVDPTVSLIGLLGRVATVTLKHAGTDEEISCAMYSLAQVKTIKIGDKLQVVGMPSAIILGRMFAFDLNECSLY